MSVPSVSSEVWPAFGANLKAAGRAIGRQLCEDLQPLSEDYEDESTPHNLHNLSSLGAFATMQALGRFAPPHLASAYLISHAYGADKVGAAAGAGFFVWNSALGATTDWAMTRHPKNVQRLSEGKLLSSLLEKSPQLTGYEVLPKVDRSQNLLVQTGQLAKKALVRPLHHGAIGLLVVTPYTAAANAQKKTLRERGKLLFRGAKNSAITAFLLFGGAAQAITKLEESHPETAEMIRSDIYKYVGGIAVLALVGPHTVSAGRSAKQTLKNRSQK